MWSRRWSWLLAVAFLATVFVFSWGKRQRNSEPRPVAEVEAEEQKGPRGWQGVASRIRSTLQPYLDPVRKMDPEQVVEKWMQNPQTLKIGESKMKLKLSTDWVYAVDPRKRTMEFLPLQGVQTAGDFVREYRKRMQETGATIQLVFYEKDADPDPRNRIVMTERLYLKAPGAGLEKQMEKTLGLKLYSEPGYAPGIKIYSATDALEALAALSSLDSVAGVNPTPVLAFGLQPCAAPNDPLYPNQWHLKATNQTSADGSTTVSPGEDCNVENVWGYPGSGGYRGRGIYVAVLDSGVQLSHPDLVNNLLSSIYHYDFLFPPFDQAGYGVSSPTSTGGGGPKYSDDNHGTAVAGVIAARGNNLLGGTGVAPEAKVLSYRILGSTPYPNQSINWTPTDFNGSALQNNNSWVHIKNNSWVYTSYYTPFDNLERAALLDARTNGRSTKGTIMVFAAGNSDQQLGRSDYLVHGADRGVIYVGALDHTGAKAAYSSQGASILVSAPSGNWFPSAPTTTTTDRTGSDGYNINGANNDYSDLNYTTIFNGTSSATPVVSGVIALMLEANSSLGWRDVQEILLRSARKNAPADFSWVVNGAGFRVSHRFGFGCVNAEAAVQMALAWTNNLPTQYRHSMTNDSVEAIGNNNGSTLVKQFIVPSSYKLRCESVALMLDITHPSRGDLKIELVSPAGTVSTFAIPYTVNANVDDLSNWTYRSVQSWGERAAGTWTLRVADLQAGEEGAATLNSAVLQVYGVNATDGQLPPSFLRFAANAQVSEGASIGSVAAVVESSDEGGADTLSLAAGTGDTHNGYFEISGKNLLVKQSIDFKNLSGGVYDPATGTYSLKIRLQATDASGVYSIQRELLLPIRPQNNYAPLDFYLADPANGLGVYAGKRLVVLGPKPSGASLGQFRAVDFDRPEIGGDTYVYSLVGGLGSQDNGKFQVVGDLLQAAEVLSPGALVSYQIRVRATDSGGNSIEKVFQIFQTATPSGDSDGDYWDDPLEIAKTGSLSYDPMVDTDGDGAPNAFDVNPLLPPWITNAVQLSQGWVAENNSTGWIHVAELQTVATTYDDLQVASYELISGAGGTDNNKFQIIGNSLYLAGPILESQQASYSIRIRATREINPWFNESSSWSSVTSVLTLQVVGESDKDFDSLPDAWEMQKFGNLDQGPWGDADGDGCPNRLEYVSGSDAMNASVRGSTALRQWGYLGYLNPPPSEATNLVSIASGRQHIVGIRSDGTVVAWGNNSYGEIAVPSGLTNVLAVAAGKEFSVALKGDGTVVGWGLNDYGQADAKSFLPLKIREIAAGNAHVVARMEDGTVRVWGGGDGVTQLPAGLSWVRSVAAGTDSGMVVQADRSALGWGFSQTNTGLDGKFGQAKAPADLTNARALAFGGFHTLALGTNGTVTAWGSNSDGQSTVPSSATNVVKVAAGLNSWHSLALRADGTVVGWGVQMYAGGVPSDLTNAVDIAAGWFHGAALAATVTTQAPPNQSPTDITLSLSGGSVPENTAFGATIGLFVVADPDSGDSQTLSLVSGSGDTDNWMVQLSGMSLLLNTTLNYEFKSSYSIRVRTTDSAGSTLEKSFTIPVGNVLTDDDDNDGLTEAEEIAFGTNPNSQDSDGDGYLDYAEKMAGTKGNNASEVPNEIKDFIKFQTMSTGPETRSFVFFTRMNHKHTVLSSTDLVTWTNDGTIYPTNPFIGTGRHTNMSIYTYSPKFFMKIVTVTNSNTVTMPPGGGGGTPWMNPGGPGSGPGTMPGM